MKSSSECRATSEVILSCGDGMIYSPPPALGDIVWCSKCGNYRAVKGNARTRRTFTLNLRCRDCTYSRHVEEMREAEIQGNSHAIRKGHTLDIVTNSGTTRKTILPIVTES